MCLGPERYGKVGVGENHYRYNGKELNEDLGLYDYGARWYDPAIGRWNAVDPMADAAPEWTPYRYGFNNPIKYIDPDGAYEWRVNSQTGEYERFGDKGGDTEQYIYFDDAEEASATLEGETIYVGAVAKDRYSDGEFTYGVSTADLWADVPEEYQGAYDKFDLAERYNAQQAGDAKYQSIREQENAGLSWRDMIWNVQDYGIYLDNKYGSQAGFIMAYDGGLLGGMIPGGMNATGAAAHRAFSKLAQNGSRGFNPSFTPRGAGSNQGTSRALVPYSPMRPLGKMSWNQFRSANKGQFKGPNHMQKAAKAYKKYKASFQ